jgi:hypothetical protein
MMAIAVTSELGVKPSSLAVSVIRVVVSRFRSPNCDVCGRDLQRQVYVDSSRPVCATAVIP